MAQPITMPKLGLTMTEGTLVEWLVPDGADVRAGEAIAVIETEKSNVDLEAEAAGTVQQVAAAGATLPVEAVIGHLLAPGEDRVAG